MEDREHYNFEIEAMNRLEMGKMIENDVFQLLETLDADCPKFYNDDLGVFWDSQKVRLKTKSKLDSQDGMWHIATHFWQSELWICGYPTHPNDANECATFYDGLDT